MGSSSGAVELMTKEEFDIPDENIRKEIEEYLSKNPIENDWNNLRNRPFYAVPVDSETAVDIISQMNPANSYGIRKSYSFGIDSDGTWLEIGKPLHIFIDGVEYQLTVEETTIEGVMYRYVGNPHLVGEFPENIPGFNFAIYAKLTDGVVEYHRVYMNTTLPEDSHTIIINEQVLEYHKIPIEYLPDGYEGGTSAEVTAESIKEALGYTPANAENYDELSAAINKKTSTFYVSITESGGNYVADKTMEEITAAHESGSLVFARVLYSDIPIVLSTVTDQMLPEMILFAGSFGNVTIGANMMADNSVIVTIQETALEENVPKKTSQLTNDSGCISLSRANDTYAKKATTLSGYGITDGAKKSGWTPNKHIGTDANGNMVAIETFTESEKEALKQEIIDAIKVISPDAHVIYGDVDENNNIIIYGELADGTYTLKYENEDGTTTEIGNLVISDIEYETVNAMYTRVGGSDYRMYLDINAGGYISVCQTSGDEVLYNNPEMTNKTIYYPVKVPEGKTKVSISLPNVNESLYMAVFGATLSNGTYTRSSSSGWLAKGVYEHTFGTSDEYLMIHFRNDSYGDMSVYDFSGLTVSWE